MSLPRRKYRVRLSYTVVVIPHESDSTTKGAVMAARLLVLGGAGSVRVGHYGYRAVPNSRVTENVEEVSDLGGTEQGWDGTLYEGDR